MSKLLKQLLALATFLLILPATVAAANAVFLPLDQIKPGMHGTAKTVVSGSKIEEFGVEVLAIMPDKGPAGDLVLVRTYGDVIDRTEGIVQGMSGSPVYIDGKLVGAIAYGWPLTDHRIAMVTPIGDMLKLWQAPDSKNIRTSKPFDFQLEEDTELQSPDEQLPQQDGDVESSLVKDDELQPVATPLMASGFSQSALNMLSDRLKPMNLVPYAVGGAPEGIAFGQIEPGSAIGLELIRGDISLSALGTVTYVEDGKVLAFGHPFLRRGNTSYFMTEAHVFTTVSALENGFKVGTTGQARGVINQDRSAGIAGRLDYYPSVVPMRVHITDQQLGLSRDFTMQVVDDEQLTPVLAASAMFSAIDKTMDRGGGGTARVSFEIMARNMPGGTIKRDNMFYNAANIGELSIMEFFEAMSVLANNKFNPVEIIDVKVNVNIDQERQTAAIVEAKALASSVQPGDTVPIAIKLKPYRGEVEVKQVDFIVPKDQPEGPLLLSVRGGGLVSVTDLLLRQQGIDVMQTANRNKSFDDILKDFQTANHNNDIVIEPLAGAQPLPGQGEAAAQNSSKKGKNQTKQRPVEPTLQAASAAGKDSKPTRLLTDYIIENDTQVVLTVVKKTNS